MATSVPFLFALQDIDQTLDGHRAAIEAARVALEDDATLAEARISLDEAEGLQAEFLKAQRDREFEVDDIKAKVEPLERKLYEGSIKNPKELQELDHQVNTYKTLLGASEAALLDQIGRVEAATTAVEIARGSIEEIESEREVRHERLLAEIAEHDAAVAALEVKRAAAAALVDDATLRVYHQLRPRTGGRAVARVERGICGGCRISLPVSIVSRARAGVTLVQCTSCQRILYGN